MVPEPVGSYEGSPDDEGTNSSVRGTDGSIGGSRSGVRGSRIPRGVLDPIAALTTMLVSLATPALTQTQQLTIPM